MSHKGKSLHHVFGVFGVAWATCLALCVPATAFAAPPGAAAQKPADTADPARITPDTAVSDEPVPVPEDDLEPEQEQATGPLPFETAEIPDGPPASRAATVEPAYRPTGIHAMTASEVGPPRYDLPPRPKMGPALVTIGLGVAVAGAVTAHYALNPQCEDPDNILSCTVPNGADIRTRAALLGGAIAFGIGGATFGGLGGRELARNLARVRGGPKRGRAIATGIGTTSLLVGTGGLIAGSVLLGLGLQGSLSVAETIDETGISPDSDDPAEAAQASALVTDGVGDARVARTGLSILIASPAFVSLGIGLLVNRPKSKIKNKHDVQVSPQFSQSFYGLSASARF